MALPQDGQDANGLTKVTQIPAGKELMFIDPTTNEGGIITLEDLTKQILSGITSQAFNLDAGQMTLIQALNDVNRQTQITYTVNKEDFGNVIKNSGLLEKNCNFKVFICNDSTNNPIGTTSVILLFHSVFYWEKHPHYICCRDKNISTGVLDCTDVNTLKII